MQSTSSPVIKGMLMLHNCFPGRLVIFSPLLGSFSKSSTMLHVFHQVFLRVCGNVSELSDAQFNVVVLGISGGGTVLII